MVKKKPDYEKLIKDFYKTFIGGYGSTLDLAEYHRTGKMKYRDTVFMLNQHIDFTGNDKAREILTEMFYICHPKAPGRKK